MSEKLVESSNSPNEYLIAQDKKEMPQILFYLNPSNGKHIECDSGVIFNKLLLKELKNMGYTTYVASDINPSLSTSQFYPISQGENKYSVRFNFDGSRMNEILQNLPDIKIFFLNQTEHGVNVKSTFVQTGREDLSLVSYYHYFSSLGIEPNQIIYDPSLNQGNMAKYILQRQLETAELSNSILIHSEFGKRLLKETAEYLNFDDFSNRINIIPAPLDLGLHPKRIVYPNSKDLKLLYNNRLYDHYGIRTITSYLDQFAKNYDNNFEFILTNPTSGRSSERNALDNSITTNLDYLSKRDYVKVDHRPSYGNYHELINEITIGIAPHRPALWSMSTLDVMASWKPVIAPSIGAFPEILPKELLYTTGEEFCELIAKLTSNESFYRRMQMNCRQRAELVRSEKIGEMFNQVFSEVL